MTIHDVRIKVELEQYAVRQAIVALKAAMVEGEPGRDENLIMLDIALATLDRAYTGLGEAVQAMTEVGRPQPRKQTPPPIPVFTSGVACVWKESTAV